jgi:hypothetical protein
MVFPHGHAEVDQHVFMNPKSISEALALIREPSVITPVIIGCFEYHPGFTDQHFQTRFLFRLDRYYAAQPNKQFGINPIKDRTTPAGDLRLVEVPGGQDAN